LLHLFDGVIYETGTSLHTSFVLVLNAQDREELSAAAKDRLHPQVVEWQREGKDEKRDSHAIRLWLCGFAHRYRIL
jgi:hypothetical protein